MEIRETLSPCSALERERLVRKARESGVGLLAHARPFLVTYLGRGNAAQLLQRIGATLEPGRDGART